MGILDIIEAAIKLGIPMVVLSWLIFSWLYRDGKLDRQAGRKDIAANVKQMKTSFKSKDKQKTNYVYDKWMWFGSGFYGLAALWTFIIVEISQFFSFLFNFPGFESLFGEGLFNFLVALALGQLGNIINAFIWFVYWSDDGSILVYFLVAYMGYWCGVELAKRGEEIPIGQWLNKLFASLPQIDIDSKIEASKRKLSKQQVLRQQPIKQSAPTLEQTNQEAPAQEASKQEQENQKDTK